jgi:hypothetical protein
MSPIARTYPSLEAFYAEDPRRLNSRERDIGLYWRAGRSVTFRAAWVQGTGEVYLFRHGAPLEGGGTVKVIRRRFSLYELQRELRGYREVVGRRESLAWFLERVGESPMPAAA